MSATKVLEVVSELDVHLTLTPNGVGVSIASEEDIRTSFSEYTWHEIIDDIAEYHAIPVLAANDEKISRDSHDVVIKAAQKMRQAANLLTQRIERMEIVEPSLN